MIFKQGIMKEELLRFLALIGCMLLPLLALFLITLIKGDDMMTFSVIAMLFAPIFSVGLVIGLDNLEWYHVYDDRIEARGILGVKNTVYFSKVKSVEAVKINLTTRGVYRDFLVFNDGRESHKKGAIFAVNSCHNKRKYSLRIYKTEKIEEYVKSRGLKIKDSKRKA